MDGRVAFWCRGLDLGGKEVEDLLRGVLRGAVSRWPAGMDASQVEAFIDVARRHGVQGVLHERLQPHREGDWPAALVHGLRRDALREAAAEMLRQQAVAEVLAALAAVDIEPVLFKGTALAYSLYPDPALRPRCDTDLIVPLQQRQRALDALGEIGFSRVLELGGAMSHQACLTRSGVGAHTLDLHWHINNSELLARLFSYEDLRAGARRLPRLAPHALGACPMHALLIACMHRASHRQPPALVDGTPQFGSDRLIWLYDIHLLVEVLRPVEWDEFLGLAERRGFRAVCLEALEQARTAFGSPVPDRVLERLSRPGAPEPTALYLQAGPVRRRWLEFQAREGLRGKLRFARELALPPAIYMREFYPNARMNWLPWLYLRRAFSKLCPRCTGARG